MTKWPSIYHGSPTAGLKRIEPRRSTHGQAWVYGTPHLEMVATYIAKWDDIDCAQWHIDGQFYLIERYAGAIPAIYQAGSGSIYRLAADTFRELEPGGPEVVSDVGVEILDERLVTNGWAYLQEVASAGKLSLFFYPNRPDFVPDDDSDLLKKVLKWVRAHGPRREDSGVYQKFLAKHPALKSRLDRLLDEP